MQVLASQLPFLTNGNAELAVPPLLSCIKIGRHVALLNGPTVYLLHCATSNNTNRKQIAQNIED